MLLVLFAFLICVICFVICVRKVLVIFLKKAVRIIDSFFALFTAVIYSLIIYGTVALPNNVVVYGNDLPKFQQIYNVTAHKDYESVDFQSADSVGGTDGELKLLGVIPVKNETIISSESNKVLVSGKSFGIKLYTDGVIIVGTKDINIDGKTVNPSKSAGLQVGDVIVSINGKRVYSSDEVENVLNDNNGKDYIIKIKRNSVYKTFTLHPVYVQNEGCYKAGMWVRDSTAGIGTVTFYYPKTSTVATLGHPVTDVDTGDIMPILNGEAVETCVTSVTKSSADETGSLSCDFLNKSIAALTKNTTYGVYGKYTNQTDLSGTNAYEIASVQEIEKGFCQIICTVEGETPKTYSAQIQRIFYNENEKNMIIKITDEELLQKTGGIVQGMSGTPIIQNGKLIGAITHVIVNNPQKGYAVFAQTMADECK